MILKNFRRACAAVAMTMMLAGAASAQTLFFNDNFNGYPVGALDTDVGAANNGPGPWDAHSGTGVGSIAASASGAGNNIVTALQGTTTATEDIHRDTGQMLPYGGATWYYSAKIKVIDTRPDTTSPVAPVYFMHFMESLTPLPAGEQQFRARLYVLPSGDSTKFSLGISSGTKTLSFPTDPDFDGDNGVNGRDFLRWQANYGLTPAANSTGDADDNDVTDDADFGIWKSLFGYYTAVRFPQDLTFGQTYTVVASYTSDDDDTNALLTSDGHANLWVDPADINSTKVTDTEPNANIVNDATRPQRWLGIRQGSTFPFNTTSTVEIDSVAIGNDFGVVLAGLNPSGAAVPEPASMWLVGCGAAALTAVARRRRT